ncbi:hypothetical protein B6A42_01485 [Vibrio coralliilyticus]|nr:hypothetical protein B6A42_01485 [Vibrio coralliilyticus]
MNITFIIYSMSNGGAERVVASLSNYFCSKGHNVNILTQTNEDSFYTLDKRVNLTSIEKNESSGIKGYLRRSWAIRQFLKNSEADLAISFMTSSNIVLSIASLGLKCRSFGSERTYPPLHNLPKKLNILRKIFYRFLDGVVVQTTDTKAWFYNNITTKSLEIIPNPINYPFQDTYPTVEVPLRSNGRKSIISVGRLVASKGHSQLIKSFLRYQDALKDTDLYILGGGKNMTI